MTFNPPFLFFRQKKNLGWGQGRRADGRSKSPFLALLPYPHPQFFFAVRVLFFGVCALDFTMAEPTG